MTLLEELLERAREIAESKPDRFINPTELERHIAHFEKRGKITKERAKSLRRNRLQEKPNKETDNKAAKKEKEG
jgi:hypothetical protein